MVRKDLLDDSNAAKEPVRLLLCNQSRVLTRIQMDLVKKRLKWLFRPGEYKRPEFAWPVPTEEPMTVRSFSFPLRLPTAGYCTCWLREQNVQDI